MNAVVQFVVKHGYPILFAAIFARQIGLPVPAPLFLLAAGALAAVGKLNFFAAFALAVTGCVLADWAWYEAGRRWGNRVLHFLHRFSPDPDTADRRAKERFARYGPPLLVPAKFVPGLDAVVPPLAGTSRTSRVRFLAFETVGASLWSGGYAGLGYFFSQDLGRVAAYAATAGRLTASLAFGALSMYAIPKLLRWHRHRQESQLQGTTQSDPVGSSAAKRLQI